MIEFMVLSAPRSGSTWMSNWLTTQASLCLHDPILEHSPEDLDAIECDRMLGISCTGMALLTDWVNAHPARKVIVHRPLEDINRSLKAIGLSPLSQAWDGALEKIKGWHVPFSDLFNTVWAAPVWEHLTHTLHDRVRHAQLCKMHIDPEFGKVPIVRDRTRDFRERIQRALA
jgi:hypothetical protein